MPNTVISQELFQSKKKIIIPGLQYGLSQLDINILSAIHFNTCLDQKILGDENGRRRETVNVRFKRLREDGLIETESSKKYSPHRKHHLTTNIYRFAKKFYDLGLINLIRNFYIFSIALLSSIGSIEAKYHKNLTLVKTSDFFNTNSIVIDERRLKKKEEKVSVTSEEKARRHEIALKISELIPLTPHGFADLEKYPVPAMMAMLDAAPSARSKAKPHSYIGSVGRLYCEKHGLKVDYADYYQTLERLGIDKRDKNYVDSSKMKPNQMMQSSPKPDQIVSGEKEWRPGIDPERDRIRNETDQERFASILAIPLDSFISPFALQLHLDRLERLKTYAEQEGISGTEGC